VTARGLIGWLAGFARARGGGLATTTAIAAPAVALLICGGVDLSAVQTVHKNFQDVADATALDAAHQLGISDPVGLTTRANQFARQQLEGVTDTSYTVTTTIVDDNKAVRVAIDGSRMSFFGNLLPPGGWKIGVSSKASALNLTPLCVISTGADNLGDIKMDGSAKMTAAACLVHSNQDIEVKDTALLQADTVQSSGLATGRISPAPQVGAPEIADPFANLGLNNDPGVVGGLLCALPIQNILSATLTTLAAGPHCGHYLVAKGQTLHLAPGDHYFLNGDLDLKDDAQIDGSDVVLIFDKKSKFHFKDSAKIMLKGRRSGRYAGFVIATTRDNNGTFEISSNSARELLGTIYIPSAKLQVTGSGDQVADQSAWTVIVAKSIEMHGSPNLVVNANYAGSPVPVPAGVGPTGGTRLVD
jgi:Flp pilus assembly protein TadG